MKKNIYFILSTGISAILLSSPVWGQQSLDNDAVGKITAESLRPEMPRLFYTGEQRRVLEAVRQDVISEETFEEEDFVPLILRQEQIDIVAEAQVDRSSPIVFDSFVRNRNTGKGVWWSDNEERDFSVGEEDKLSREGIVQLEPSQDGDGTIIGIDKFNNTRFILKVGQQLSPDGEVGETYPVVIKKN